ncbi:MAG: helix-turn-helix domain-containing protein [Candidatus Hadarchaeaceae archaeon]
MTRRRRKKVNSEMIKKMKRLRRKGMSYNKIAGRLGLSVMTVYNYLQKKEKVGLLDKLKQKLGFR